MRYSLMMIAACVSLVGCGGKRQVQLVPAKGRLMLQQKNGQLTPMAGAKVVFIPVAGEGNLPSFPGAAVAADGSFQLGTYAAGDGAPEGDFIVTVEWKELIKPKHDVFGKGEVPRGPDRLRGGYSDRASSPLRATVVAGRELAITIPASRTP